MGEPTSLLGQARAFARDFPRDQMPAGYLWDIVDFVPQIIDASLTGRGGWAWGSDPAGGDIESGIFATFLTGDQLLVQTSTGQLQRVYPDTGVVTPRGPIARAIQNPIQIFDTVVHFDASRTTVPALITDSAVNPSDATAPKARVGAIWQNAVVADGGPGREDWIRFGVPSEPTQPWDSKSEHGTAGAVTGLGVVRSVLIIFHAGSTERLRGDEIPTLAGNLVGNLVVESLSTSVGCSEPRSIANWSDNLIFADEHGVHMTDGAVVRNIVSQGGISYFWRTLWGQRLSVSASVFLDYYVITIRQPAGPVTLVCDLTRRQWFRFSHINAGCYVASAGGGGTERLWSGLVGTSRLALISPCFFPNLAASTAIVDADGAAVFPVFETPWYRLSKEGRKRIRFAYVSYDARAPAPAEVLDLAYVRSPPDTGYATLGQLPSTTMYRRYRLPLGQSPYGVAFRVRQVSGTSALRVYDLAVEANTMESSRV